MTLCVTPATADHGRWRARRSSPSMADPLDFLHEMGEEEDDDDGAPPPRDRRRAGPRLHASTMLSPVGEEDCGAMMLG